MEPAKVTCRVWESRIRGRGDRLADSPPCAYYLRGLPSACEKFLRFFWLRPGLCWEHICGGQACWAISKTKAEEGKAVALAKVLGGGCSAMVGRGQKARSVFCTLGCSAAIHNTRVLPGGLQGAITSKIRTLSISGALVSPCVL